MNMSMKEWYGAENTAKNREKGFVRAVLHLLGVVAAAAIFLAVFGKWSVKTGVYAAEGGIRLEMPSGSTCEIIYEDITELKLISLPDDYGVCIDGDRKKGCSYGVWENDDWGSYTLCVKDDVPDAVWIRQGNDIIVFNYEGSKPTKSFYEALQKKLQ